MGRDYGSLSNSRRGQSAGWQWFVFGAITGIIATGCVVATLLVTIAFEVVSVPGVAIGPSPQPEIQFREITSTPAPMLPTDIPPAATEAAAVAPPTDIPPAGEPATTDSTDIPDGSASLLPTSTTAGLDIDAPPVGDTEGGVSGGVVVAPTPTSAVQLPSDFIAGAEGEAQALDEADIAPSAGDAGGSGSAIGVPPAAQGGAALPDVLVQQASPLVAIAGNTFQMGTTASEGVQAVRECTDVWGGACTPAMVEDAGPVHQVQLDDYLIEENEVTYEQYIRFLNLLGPRSHLNGCDGEPCLETQNETDTSNVQFNGQTYDIPDIINNLPVVNVTWYGAQSYCEAIGRRLPTESEWEYAARGPEGFIYPWGNGEFIADNARTNRPIPENPLDVGAVPVRSYPAYSGLYDMAGNAAEWVFDWYDPGYYSQFSLEGANNPSGPVGGTERSVRGGSWDSVPLFARSVHRQSHEPRDGDPWLGFRCAADPESIEEAPRRIEAEPLSPEDLLSGPGDDTAGGVPTLPPAAGGAAGGNAGSDLGASEEQPLAEATP